jgi:exonuclease III
MTLHLTTAVATWNANGLMARVLPGGEVVDEREGQGGRERWWFLVKLMGRMGVEVVGVQEARLRGVGWRERLQWQLRRKGYESVWTLEGTAGRGVGLVWKAAKWRCVRVEEESERMLRAVLSNGTSEVSFVVGHAPNGAVERMRWWQGFRAHTAAAWRLS